MEDHDLLDDRPRHPLAVSQGPGQSREFALGDHRIQAEGTVGRIFDVSPFTTQLKESLAKKNQVTSSGVVVLVPQVESTTCCIL